MKPNKPGIWEWFGEDGTRRLVSVFNVVPSKSYLRVYWWGGYYNVNDEFYGHTDGCPAEWPDRWGQWIGENGSIPEDQIYNGPTPEQREKIFAKLEKQS